MTQVSRQIAIAAAGSVYVESTSFRRLGKEPSTSINLHRPHQPLVALLDFAFGSEILPIEPGTKKRCQCLIMCLIPETSFFSIVFTNFPVEECGDLVNLHIIRAFSQAFFQPCRTWHKPSGDFWDLFFAAATFHAHTQTHTPCLLGYPDVKLTSLTLGLED